MRSVIVRVDELMREKIKYTFEKKLVDRTTARFLNEVDSNRNTIRNINLELGFYNNKNTYKCKLQYDLKYLKICS